MGKAKPKVFAWVNAGAGTEWQIVVAIADDGTALASHCSSSEYFAKNDIEKYASAFAKHYPDGYEFEWVRDPRDHAELGAALDANEAMSKATNRESAREVQDLAQSPSSPSGLKAKPFAFWSEEEKYLAISVEVPGWVGREPKTGPLPKLARCRCGLTTGHEPTCPELDP